MLTPSSNTLNQVNKSNGRSHFNLNAGFSALLRIKIAFLLEALSTVMSLGTDHTCSVLSRLASCLREEQQRLLLWGWEAALQV